MIVLGTGFFKPNGYTMVGQLYRPGDPRRDPGFTLYYMAINLGALLGPLVCAWLAADPRYGWSYGFGAAGAAMLVGLVFCLWARRHWLHGIGLPPAGRQGTLRVDAPLTPAERRRILAIATITVFVVFFWLAFEQVGSSLNVFAAHRTDRMLGGWLAGLVPGGEIPATWFQAINPFFILLLAPLVAELWRRLGARAPSTPAKMALGLALLGLAYIVMVIGAAQSDAGARVSPWILVAFYFVFRGVHPIRWSGRLLSDLRGVLPVGGMHAGASGAHFEAAYAGFVMTVRVASVPERRRGRCASEPDGLTRQSHR